MPSITQQTPANIMIVDDNAANLKLLEDMLRQQGHEVRSFPRGRLALAGAGQEPPDLVLLDINMPEMDGYEVCEQLKANERLAGIPVIFLSALNAIEDKVKGFRCGGVDYISKPFQFEEVMARVETHVKLRRALQAEHDLLERTLGGAVGTLCDLVQVTSPILAARARSIQDIVQWLTKREEIPGAWQFELAARLCLIGCVALPDDVFERAYCGQKIPEEEERMFQAHPERASLLLSHIPRMEGVAEIVREQQKPGLTVLHLALELDRRLFRGLSASAALAEVGLLHRFDRRLLSALEGYSPTRVEFEMRRLPIKALRAGMVIEHDVMTKDGNMLILKAGTVLTDVWIERLSNFAKTRGTQELVGVRVPRVSVTEN